MDFFICLIGSIIVVLITTWLIFSNYELRQKNHDLLIDNCNLFQEKSRLSWHLDQTKHELKLFKAEFCAPKTRNNHANTMEKRQ